MLWAGMIEDGTELRQALSLPLEELLEDAPGCGNVAFRFLDNKAELGHGGWVSSDVSGWYWLGDWLRTPSLSLLLSS